MTICPACFFAVLGGGLLSGRTWHRPRKPPSRKGCRSQHHRYPKEGSKSVCIPVMKISCPRKPMLGNFVKSTVKQHNRCGQHNHRDASESEFREKQHQKEGESAEDQDMSNLVCMWDRRRDIADPVKRHVRKCETDRPVTEQQTGDAKYSSSGLRFFKISFWSHSYRILIQVTRVLKSDERVVWITWET